MALKIKTNKQTKNPSAQTRSPSAPSFTSEINKLPYSLLTTGFKFQNVTPVKPLIHLLMQTTPKPVQPAAFDKPNPFFMSFDARNEMVVWRFQPDWALETLTQPEAFTVLLYFKPEFVKGISLKGFVSDGKQLPLKSEGGEGHVLLVRSDGSHESQSWLNRPGWTPLCPPAPRKTVAGFINGNAMCELSVLEGD